MGPGCFVGSWLGVVAVAVACGGSVDRHAAIHVVARDGCDAAVATDVGGHEAIFFPARAVCAALDGSEADLRLTLFEECSGHSALYDLPLNNE